MLVQFHKVMSLPGTLQPNALYFVENGNYAEAYLTDDAGVGKAIGNTTMIETIAGGFVGGGGSTSHVVGTIAARDLIATPATGDLAYVIDATGDGTVASGAALYVRGAASWLKIAEFESLDVVVQWAGINGKPSSSAAAIDAAVTASHTHANAALLAKVGEASGDMTYDGNPVGAWNTNNW